MKNPSRIVAFAAVLLAACSSNPKTDDDDRPRRDRADVPSLMNDQTDPLAARREERRLAALDAEQLYWRARTALDSTDFPSAIDGYDRLSTQYPFSPFATQGKLERMYALYRNFEPDRALSSADRFLREHPRHPEVDYVYYLKGLVNFRRNESGLTVLPMDETRSDITSQRRAFDDFSLLLQRYPDSKYAGDAYDRMVFIRNRISEHDLHVVDFYVRRGAYVAAAKRAEQIISQYPGTPASYRALDLLVKCYELAGLEQQAQDARTLRQGQSQPVMVSEASSSAALAAARTEAAEQSEVGFLGRLAGLFSAFDNPNEIEIILPSAAAEKGDATTTAKPESASPSAADADAVAETAAADGERNDEPERDDSSKLEIFYEPPGSVDENAPVSVQP